MIPGCSVRIHLKAAPQFRCICIAGNFRHNCGEIITKTVFFDGYFSCLFFLFVRIVFVNSLFCPFFLVYFMVYAFLVNVLKTSSFHPCMRGIYRIFFVVHQHSL